MEPTSHVKDGLMSQQFPRNLHLIEEINRGKVLELLRYHSPLSRVDLARETGLNSATISSIMRDFTERNLVRELGFARSARSGRKPMLYEFNRKAGIVAVASLTGQGHQVAILDLGLKILEQKEIRHQPQAQPQSVVASLTRYLEELVARAESKHGRCYGIGISVRGWVDQDTGRVVRSTQLDWNDVPILERLEETFPEYPIYIESSVQVRCMGEWRARNDPNLKNFVYVDISRRGIGAGVIIDGRMYHGMNGSAGDLGHCPIDSHGPLCTCGNSGCLEAFVSESLMVSRAKEVIARHPSTQLSAEALTMQTILTAAEKGDALARELVDSAAVYLGMAIAIAVNLYAPQLLVVGGSLLSGSQWFFDRIKEEARKRVFHFNRDRISIDPSMFDEHDAVIIGSAAHTVQRVLDFPSVV